jgi:peptidoglycan hydrolase-like protein with peptidoglycan-binding domain
MTTIAPDRSRTPLFRSAADRPKVAEAPTSGLNTLTQAVQQGGLISAEQNSRGPAVRELQQALKDRGHNIQVDGIFGPETHQRVRAFQAAKGAKIDGVVGPETLAALQGRQGGSDRVESGRTRADTLPTNMRPAAPRRNSSSADRSINGVPVSLAPRGASEEQAYQHYEKLINASGGKIVPGQKHVLALRGMDPDTGKAHSTTARRDMKDTMVTLWRDDAGKAHVKEMAGSTYPGQRASRASPDVTGDRVGDVGMIAEGNYKAVPNGNYKGKPSFHVRTTGGSGNLPGVRDTNHDGVHSASEWANSRRRNDKISSVLFHRGNGNNVSSIGCLNVGDYDKFVKNLGGGGTRFNVTLLNAQRPEFR